MKVKTSELSGPDLDWAVAKCEGVARFSALPSSKHYYAPSTKWAQGGPIIEREGVSIAKDGDEHWRAGEYLMTLHHYGPTPLIAAMRCYVASKLGDVVDVPDNMVS